MSETDDFVAGVSGSVEVPVDADMIGKTAEYSYTYYSHCSPLRKAKPTGILHFAKGKTDCGRPNKNIPFS